MSLMQNCQLHICENIQCGGFCWVPELRRLFFPRLIWTIFGIFVLQDLNSTKLLSLKELPPEARDVGRTQGADLGDVKIQELCRTEGRRECSVLYHSEREDVWKQPGLFPQSNQACKLGKRLLVRDTNKIQLVTLDWLQRSCMQMGGKFKERQWSLQHSSPGLMADNDISCIMHKHSNLL